MSLKIHKNLVAAVIQCLKEIFLEDRYADRVIESMLRSNPKWGSKDRGFIAETTYEMVRKKRLLYEIYNHEVNKQKSLYHLFAIYLEIFKKTELPRWDEFADVPIKEYQKNYKAKKHIFAIKESYSEWMYDRCVEELGERSEPILKAMNQEAPLTLRINTMKCEVEQLSDILKKETILHKKIDLQTIAIHKKSNIFKLEAFRKGFFEVQDYGSQQIGLFCQVSPGMRVIDACAGAGGKSLHLATEMQNKGRIIAMDVEDWKLEEMKKRAKRNGISIIEPRLIDSMKTIKRLYDSADVVLLDVPCTGIGVIKRNPDAKWKITAEMLAEVQVKQKEILENYSKMTKVGGHLIYATCSILPSENQLQVQHFLQGHAGFVLEAEQNLYPGEYPGDGFYMARLKRRSE